MDSSQRNPSERADLPDRAGDTQNAPEAAAARQAGENLLNELAPTLSREAQLGLAGPAVSHYRILGKLGAGGMGLVYKAEDLRLKRLVAMKVLPPDSVADPERKRRFLQEARAGSALNHPNIVTVYDVDRASGIDFIAMEFAPSRTLHDLIRGAGLPVGEALGYAIQVAGALAAAHAAGIVHRDLKPGNIIVSESGCAKVLDFGIAKLFGATEGGATEEGRILGTVAYMSPEQAEGKNVDARTDIFSFGAVLYEMVTGRRAFTGSSAASILSAILRDQPKPAAEFAKDVPPQLGKIISRCLQKDPARRYQHAGDLEIDLQLVREDLSGTALRDEAQPGRLPKRRLGIAAAAGLLVMAFAAGWLLHRSPAPDVFWNVIRLSTDPGLSDSPALSPDGKLVVYSSDRGMDGQQDLYLKQVAGGPPVRLTFDGAGNTTPDFSPDGTKIAFRSARDGGGIYEVPALGGDARLVARDGRNPKYSPDGTQIAYWVGAWDLSWNVAPTVPGSGTVWVIPAAGGQPQQVGRNFTAARFPIWCPDGKHLLVLGYTSTRVADSSSLDWWMASANGGEAVRTGVYSALLNAGLRTRNAPQGAITPACWLPGGAVVFSMAGGDSRNLWQVKLSERTGQVQGAFRRLTTGSSEELDPACAPGGMLAFTSLESKSDIWLLPLDLDSGSRRGEWQRVTNGPAWREYPSLDGSNRYLAFASRQSGQTNIWLRDMASGKETYLAGSPFLQRFPVINASGDKVAFSVYEKDKRTVYVAARGGVPEKLCEGCLRATDWSRDGKTLLIFGGSPYQVGALDIASHRQVTLIRHPSFQVLYARFSPDNRWVSFTVRTQPGRAHIAIASLDGEKPVPESAWITIAEAGTEDWANWSPDGRTLYFTSDRDGHNCLWGQRIDAGSHRPAGAPFAVQHLHGRLSYEHRGWSMAQGRVAMLLVENTGSVWAMAPGPQ